MGIQFNTWYEVTIATEIGSWGRNAEGDDDDIILMIMMRDENIILQTMYDVVSPSMMMLCEIKDRVS